MDDGWTAPSPWRLVDRVAARLLELGVQLNAPEYGEEVQATMDPLLCRAPGLSCEIRASRRPWPLLMHVSFRREPTDTARGRELQALTRSLPGLEPPLRLPGMDDAAWRAACAAHAKAWKRWRAAQPDDPMAAYQREAERRVELQGELGRQRQSGRTCTLDVGINGRELRLPPRFIRALRKVDTQRVNPQHPDPLEALLADRHPIERLRAQGKLAEAVAMEQATQQLAAQIASWPGPVCEDRRMRRPWGEKPLWITLGETSRADVQFVLALYLLQAEVLDWSPGLSRFVIDYLGQFHDTFTHQDEDQLPARLRRDRGGPDFSQLLQSYAQPEHARALRRFIARTLHGRRALEARRREDQRPPLVDLSVEDAQEIQLRKARGQPARDGGAFTGWAEEAPDHRLVDDVVRTLRAEAADGEWVPSRDTLYDWGNAGRFPWADDPDGRKTLDVAGVERVRALVQAKRAKLALRAKARAAA